MIKLKNRSNELDAKFNNIPLNGIIQLTKQFSYFYSMLLFLDIDGVMVPANAWKKLEILEDGFPAFSAKAVKALNRILSKSGADIALITSHKFSYSLNEWKDIFTRRNIKVNTITRLPDNKNQLNRKDELLNWFHSSKIKDDFIIIDDDKSLNALPAFLKDKLIQPSASVGLTEELADQALGLIAKSKQELT